jgi:hypothetical protein
VLGSAALLSFRKSRGPLNREDRATSLLTLPMMMHRMAPTWPEGAMQRLFAFVVMVPIGVLAFVVLRKSESWERPLTFSLPDLA